MQNITLNKNDLLPIVKENKEKHDNIYNAAVSGYWVKAEEILNTKLADVKEKKKVDNVLGITFPVNYSDDYNRVIRMLELSADEKIDLSSNEFDSYVRNQWHWKNSFLSTNSTYMTGFLISSGYLAKF